MKKNYILFILLLLPILFAFKNQDSTNKAKQIIKVQSIDTTGLSEAKAYKMLYEDQVKSNDSILKTIYYALGGLGTAVLLVFASNWWFNEKKVRDTAEGINAQITEAKNAALNEVREKTNTYTSEKNSEINSTLKKLQEDVTSNISNLMVKFTELSDKTRNENTEYNKTLTLSFEERIKNYSENFSMQIKTLEKLLVDRFEIHNQKLETIDKTINQKFDKKIGILESKITNESNKIKREVFSTAAELADNKGAYPRAFRNYLEVALTEEKLGWMISYLTLDSILESLQKTKYIYKDEEIDLLRLLKNLEGNDEMKKKITDCLKTIKIEEI